MLQILHPPTYLPERHYIFATMLQDFLGLDFHAEIGQQQHVQITVRDDATGRRLIIDDSFFATPEHRWLAEGSLPSTPVSWLNLSPSLAPTRLLSGGIPMIFGTPRRAGDAVSVGEDELHLHGDLFGSAFFMLTRYEEIARPVDDGHGRFPATASLAYRAGFLDRPVVNEYVELLWACLSRLWPGLQRRQRSARVLLSHDVDWPVVTRGRSLGQVTKAAAGDVIRRQDPMLGKHRLRSWADVRAGNWDSDVGNVFDFIMRVSEQCGLVSAFYFIAGHTAGMIDGVYSLDDPWIQRLLRQIAERGHEIGLHPSYNTFLDPAATKAEFEKLLTVCHHLGIDQPAWGGRQHYLRWRNPQTWRNWADAGLSYDSTVGFADEIGFRSGVCYQYTPYDLNARQPLKLIERPLVVMDAMLLGASRRLNARLALDDAVRHIVRLKERCSLFDGDFTLLWHNTWLLQQREKVAYQTCIGALTE